jgi:hypothetical protein
MGQERNALTMERGRASGHLTCGAGAVNLAAAPPLAQFNIVTYASIGTSCKRKDSFHCNITPISKYHHRVFSLFHRDLRLSIFPPAYSAAHFHGSFRIFPGEYSAAAVRAPRLLAVLAIDGCAVV